VNPAVLLGLVLLASFGLFSLVLSGLVACLGWAAVRGGRATSLDLLALRLLPSAGALLLAFTVVLPAFLRYEPQGEHEPTGPLLWILAAFAVFCLELGLRRGARACGATRALLTRCLEAHVSGGSGGEVHLLRAEEPVAAVIGAWRPRIFVSESVRAACSAEEFRAVLAHEEAHLAARDNLKLLLLTVAPDALGLTPLAAAMTDQWGAAAEREADQRAAGADRERRLALASALIKVTRLQSSGAPGAALAMPVAADDISGRVRALLAPPLSRSRSKVLLALAALALLIPLLAVPRYALLHELIEQLVGL
jgi:beta-lactamase regulating signal transducer with metallopeptidase domain